MINFFSICFVPWGPGAPCPLNGRWLLFKSTSCRPGTGPHTGAVTRCSSAISPLQSDSKSKKKLVFPDTEGKRQLIVFWYLTHLGLSFGNHHFLPQHRKAGRYTEKYQITYLLEFSIMVGFHDSRQQPHPAAQRNHVCATDISTSNSCGSRRMEWWWTRFFAIRALSRAGSTEPGA